MRFTTRPPRADILAVIPELERLAVTAVRLHPRRDVVVDPAASKMGGTFLWPSKESRPLCTHPAHREPSPFVAVLQLRAEDFPEIEYRAGTDLFQLLWCTGRDDHELYQPVPRVFWRDSPSVTGRLEAMPPDFDDDSLAPVSCRLHPERIIEYPFFDDLPEAIQEQLRANGWEHVYQTDFATYASKVGGSTKWPQRSDVPKCACGNVMTHLLTLSDAELESSADGGFSRWLPIEEEWALKVVEEHGWTDQVKAINNPGGFLFGHGCHYFFICRRCEDWPIAKVYQR